MNASLDDATRHWALWRPNDVCIVHEDVRMTWSELDRAVESLAAGFQGLGLEPGDRLGILAGNCIEWCVAALAALRARVVVVPLNDRLAVPEIERIVEHAGCAAVVFDRVGAEKMAGSAMRTRLLAALGIGETGAQWLRPLASIMAGGTADRVEGDSEDVALIAYTSGTTGLPKGVMLTHGAILSQAAARSIEYGWSPHTLRTLLCVPLAVVGGIVTSFLLTLVSGGRLHLERGFDAARVLALVERERITTMIFVPAVWEGLSRLPGFADADLSSVTTAITGGAPVAVPLLELYQAKGVRIHQSYGMTETASFVTDVPVDLALTHNTAAGFPAMHTRVRVVNESGDDVEAGGTGEIVVRGPTVMKGYWNDPESTRAAIRSGWLHTGDIGQLDAGGMLSVIGRMKDMYISGGFNVYLAEVELALSAIPGIEECVVFAVPDDRWGEAGVAVVVSRRDLTAEDLRSASRALIASYKVPRDVVFAAEPLPRNLAGKVLRGAAKDRYWRTE